MNRVTRLCKTSPAARIAANRQNATSQAGAQGNKVFHTGIVLDNAGEWNSFRLLFDQLFRDQSYEGHCPIFPPGNNTLERVVAMSLSSVSVIGNALRLRVMRL